MGKYLIIAGALLIAVGTLMMLKVPFTWLGKLPGDYSKKVGNMRVFIPITTCIVVSVLFSLISLLVSFLRNR